MCAECWALCPRKSKQDLLDATPKNRRKLKLTHSHKWLIAARRAVEAVAFARQVQAEPRRAAQ